MDTKDSRDPMNSQGPRQFEDSKLRIISNEDLQILRILQGFKDSKDSSDSKNSRDS